MNSTATGIDTQLGSATGTAAARRDAQRAEKKFRISACMCDLMSMHRIYIHDKTLGHAHDHAANFQ